MHHARQPMVSVLMPVLNEEKSVEAALAGALGQSHPDVEVLVADGRSTDRTRDVVAAVVARDPRVRLLDNPGRSIAAGLNVGLAAARGEFVARLDGHATVNPDYIALGVGHLRADAWLAAVGGRRAGTATTSAGRAIAEALSSPFGVGNSINHYATERQNTDHASFGVYRAEVAREIGGWDEQLIANEDVDFDFRILGLGYRILYEPDMVIDWHVRESIGDLGRQYRRYGRGKGSMVRKNGPRAVRLRHLAAPVLIGLLGVSAGAALLGRPRLAAALVAPYGAAVAIASEITLTRARARGIDVDPKVLPASFITMHTTWGIGFLEGLVGRQPAMASQR